MKFCPVFCLFPAVAFCARVEPLPAPEFADTEVVTNLPFTVNLETTSRIEFSLSLDASPTNAVEVSVGTDGDGDGRLSSSEAVWTFGYDCGRWFARNADENRETDEPAPETGRVMRTFLLRKGRLDPGWNLVKVMRRGVRSVGEVVFVNGFKPGFALEIR